jgi:hypothetical protein
LGRELDILDGKKKREYAEHLVLVQPSKYAGKIKIVVTLVLTVKG